MSRVLIAATVRQRPATLRAFLAGLDALNLDGLEAKRVFIDDCTEPESSELLRAADADVVEVHAAPRPGYRIDERGHAWSEAAVWRVAALKDDLLRRAVDGGFDHCLLLDSDLVLQPQTVRHLIGCAVPVVAEVFWTTWSLQGPQPLPQVWVSHPYEMAPVRRGEQPSTVERQDRAARWLSHLASGVLTPVGGLGACTLFQVDVVRRLFRESGTVFGPLPSLAFWGEDRHFCLRCDALRIPRWADSRCPPYHIYRPSDLDRLEAWWKEVRARSTAAEASPRAAAPGGGPADADPVAPR